MKIPTPWKKCIVKYMYLKGAVHFDWWIMISFIIFVYIVTLMTKKSLVSNKCISRRILMTPRNHSCVFEHVCCIVGTDFNCKQIKTKHLPVFCIVMKAWINQDKRHYNSMLPLIPGDRRRRTRRAFTAGTRHGTPNTDHQTRLFSCVTFVSFGTVIDAKVVITKNSFIF